MKPYLVAVFGVIGLTASAERVAGAEPSKVERVLDGVWMARDDAGVWGGPSMGMTHQRGPDYQALKVLDLGGVPDAQWRQVTRCRLSAFFCVRDYSWHDAKQTNGLDEFLEIVVNGKVHRMATNSGLPAAVEAEPIEQWMHWHDFEIPKEELIRGRNEIVFRIAPPSGKAPDDYVYLGIDDTVPGGKSAVRFGSSGPWNYEAVNSIGAKGEYMVRLYLLSGERRFEAVWRPAEAKTIDPAGILQYAGAEGPTARVEWDLARLDRLAPLEIAFESTEAKDFEFSWLDKDGKTVRPAVKARGPKHRVTVPPSEKLVPSGIEFSKGLALRAVTLSGSLGYRPLTPKIDMAPLIQSPKGAAKDRPAACRIENDAIELATGRLRARFSTAGRRLRLVSLYNEVAAAEMVRQGDAAALFLVETGKKRFAGTRDFVLNSVAPIPQRSGFAASLASASIGVEATLTVWADDDLHMGLVLTNRGAKPLDFKAAFPHLEGLAISDRPEDDHYFFPWGGGIFSDAPAVIRRGYGDHEAIYQVMDLYGPARGGGLAVWCCDQDGRHKVLALRKHVPGRPEMNGDAANTPCADEYRWTSSLGAVPGIGLAYEYLRRTRKPGESFTPKDARLLVHAGDWRQAMQAYADWCHQAWQFRPYPSRLGPILNMIAVGWANDCLFRDGKYRTDFIQPRGDCYELMSWWDWSALGPKGVPIDQFAQKLGEGKQREWAAYFVKDPVTGKMMFGNNPGDYDGYNARFGGLAAFRDAIREYQKRGVFVTLYTDPFRVDHNSKCGQKWGKLWGVVQPDGKHREDYDAWRMCHDVAEYRRWVAEAMARVIRETGADGIRLDEYGHAGSACCSTLHEHTYAEPGITEWQRGVAETTKLVRQAMDAARPGSVLTTEHPGYDFLMQFIDGCITYDLSVQATSLRPVECNLQRFYFPECKAYELVYGGLRFDPGHQRRFWNAVASFGSMYPLPMDTVLRENAEVFASRDCQALVPTMARQVYVNRFAAGEKTALMLYNGTGHTFAGPVLRIELRPNERLFDLLQGQEADVTREGDSAVVRCFLARDETVSLLRLPRRLGVKRAGEILEVSAAEAGTARQVAVCDRQGQPLVTRPVQAGPIPFKLTDLPAGSATPVCVKLLDGARLVDVAALPATSR